MSPAQPAETIVSGRVVTPDGVLADGYVRVAGDRIVEAGSGQPADGRPGWVLPGFVDMHVHGGGGYAFTTGDPDQARGAAAFHLGHGTTTLLASLVTAPHDALLATTRAYAPLVAEGVIAGLHYEGPYVSAARCGAQHPAHLRPPSTVEIEALLAAGAGTVRMMTLAPELPGALDAIRLLVSRGVVAAVGHTDATYAQTVAAIEAGATVGTHVFNAMRPIHHREPGPVPALLGAAGVTCELVADGVHLHDAMLRLVVSALGAGRVALVTDAIAAAGMADGEYELGGLAVVAAGGVVRLADGAGAPGTGADGAGAIAGSALTMDAALRRSVQAGLSIVDAARMAATAPAAALGLDAVGALVPGRRADLVVLDDDLTVRAVMRGGTWMS